MKTINFSQISARSFGSHLLLFLSCLWVCGLNAQEMTSATDGQEVPNVRPEATDPASEQLIRNYLTVTGGSQAHLQLRNVVATGTLKEAGVIRHFTLIETRDGKRHLSLTWHHLGRDYKELRVFDGLLAWQQKLSPKTEDADEIGGQDGVHFATHRWLLPPFVLPLSASYVFKYQGSSRVNGRDCHLIAGYGKKNEPSWFYLDKENFLLLRWGGFGELAGVREYLDYRARSFKKVDEIWFPGGLDLLAEDAAFGTIHFETIRTNQETAPGIFTKPPSRTPLLRQRPVAGG